MFCVAAGRTPRPIVLDVFMLAIFVPGFCEAMQAELDALQSKHGDT